MRNKLSTVRINSYFGEKPELQELRRKAHERQVEFWQERGYEVVVYAYRYQPEWFIEGVRYITTPPEQKVLIAAARNILMKDFYESDEDYSFFLDNDAVVYNGPQHLDGNDFFNVFNGLDMDDLKHVDCFAPIDPRQTPFTDFNKKNAHILDSNLMFNLSPVLKGTMYCLKNLKKFYGREIYMDDERFPVGQGEIVASEDKHFASTLLWNQFGVYELRNLILKEIVPNDSTWLPETMTRGESVDKNSAYYQIMKDEFGIGMIGDRLDYSAIKRKSQKPKQVIVPKNPQEKGFFD